MSTTIAAIVTAPIVAITVTQLQTWLETRDYNRHRND